MKFAIFLFSAFFSASISCSTNLQNPYEFRNDVEHRGQPRPIVQHQCIPISSQLPQQQQHLPPQPQQQQPPLSPQQQQPQQEPPQQPIQQQQQPQKSVMIPTEREKDDSPSIVITTVNGQMRCSLITKQIEVRTENGALDWNINQSIHCVQHAI